MTVETSQLANGMRIVTDRMPGLETATVGVFVTAGARSETDNEHGVAHFLEHMAFKGTPTRSPIEIAEEIEGAGGALNAVTSSEATNYYARVLKSDVELGLNLIGDLLLNPSFSDEEMDREREVILQEIAATQDSPDDIVFDLALDEAYPNQTLGRSILGTERTISRHSAADLRRFRNENYSASRMILSAAGAVDHDAIHKLAESLFTGLPEEAPRPIKRAKFEGGHATVDKRFEQCHVIFAFEGFPNGHDDSFAGRIFAGIAGGGMASRLFQEVREKRGLCYDIHAFDWGYADSGIIGLHAATSAQQLKELSALSLGIFSDLAENGPTDRELARAKAQIKAGLFMSLESCESRAGQIAWDLMVFGRPISNEELIEKVDGVTREHVQAVGLGFRARPEIVSAVVGGRGSAAAAADAAEAFLSGTLAG
ncbi:M16 family metallopeptidase [Rhodomicrobium lacus]|jgi:predicted Zn-dependent peptidase|uniref:M16 family metallopeptidase n=1 Tax=Rhodomicrobium TaxID=1068 RepID=UPI000F8DA5AB|nr:pitrilysin family protein [Rhodomicrobium lacus]WKW51409.1 pitrilysin family protein [Rhodomicrobium lacus]